MSRKKYVTSLLRRHLCEIEPESRQRAVAAQQQRALRDLLNVGRFGGRVLKSYLSGSYARYTAIDPLDDVDIIFEIEPTAWKVPFLRNLPRPDALINSFAGAVRRRCPMGSVRRQRRSVCLELPEINIDIVPAVVEDEDAPDIILIPDRDADGWLRSAPKRHAQWATEANRRCAKVAKPLIKLLKSWNSGLPSTTATKSFVIETIAVRLLLEHPVTTLICGLSNFWDFLACVGGEACEFAWKQDFGVGNFWLRGFIVEDTAGLSGNVASSVSGEQRRLLARRSRIARQHLHTAVRARSDASSFSHLKKVFRDL